MVDLLQVKCLQGHDCESGRSTACALCSALPARLPACPPARLPACPPARPCPDGAAWRSHGKRERTLWRAPLRPEDSSLAARRPRPAEPTAPAAPGAARRAICGAQLRQGTGAGELAQRGLLGGGGGGGGGWKARSTARPTARCRLQRLLAGRLAGAGGAPVLYAQRPAQRAHPLGVPARGALQHAGHGAAPPQVSGGRAWEYERLCCCWGKLRGGVLERVVALMGGAGCAAHTTHPLATHLQGAPDGDRRGGCERGLRPPGLSQVQHVLGLPRDG